MNRIILAALAAAVSLAAYAADGDKPKSTSTRTERNLIVEGNRLFRAERYADAEVAYRKALQEDALSEVARFNLAASLLRQGSATGENEKEATQILSALAKDAADMTIAENSFYNLGNIAFNGRDYARSIEMYKNALRRNPDNDKARENLRLAQKRLEEQQNQDNNQDQNQDQNQDKQDQDKQNQDKQNQDKQDQNQDQQNKDQDKDQDKQPQQPQDKQPRQQPQQQQGGISPENAEKILKAMENEENATRQRVEAEKKKNGAPSRRPVTNPW